MKDKVTAIDIDFDRLESDGVAYYRLPEHFKAFLNLCHKKHGIVGFEFVKDSWNFGVILGKSANEKVNE